MKIMCLGGDDPLDVAFGDTTIMVVLNPTINDNNANGNVPTPGTSRAGVTVTTDEGTSHLTSARGIAVLTRVLENIGSAPLGACPWAWLSRGIICGRVSPCLKTTKQACR